MKANDTMKEVLLIRHGESQHNSEGDCLSGVTDTPLTDMGRCQARALRELLEHFSVDTVYSSPLGRALETARLAVPMLAESIHPAQCLIEFDYGDYDGFSSRDFNCDDPIFRRWEHNPGNLCFPKGGCISEHAGKAVEGLENLVSDSSGKVLACFSHKTTIRLIIAKVLNLPLDFFRRIPCDNASVTVLRWDQQNFLVQNLNLTAGILFKRSK